VSTVVLGAMAEYSVRRFRGEAMNLRQAIERGVAKFASVLGALILVTMILAGAIVLPLLLLLPLVAAGGGPGSVVVFLFGLLIAIVLAIYIVLGLALFAPAIMMENTPAVGSLSRSWNLVKGHRASLFGAVLIVAILEAAVEAAFAVPAGLPGIPVVSLVAGAVAGAITNPWIVVLLAVAYDLLARPHPAAPIGGTAHMPGTPPGVPFGVAPSAPPGTLPPPGA
jgi:hypothetical protein